MHLYLYFFSHSLLSSCSLFACGSLSLSLCLCVCVYECGHALVCCPLLIPSSSLSLFHTDTDTHSGTEQNHRCQATTRLSPAKNSKRASYKPKPAHAHASVSTNPRAHNEIYIDLVHQYSMFGLIFCNLSKVCVILLT